MDPSKGILFKTCPEERTVASLTLHLVTELVSHWEIMSLGAGLGTWVKDMIPITIIRRLLCQ